VIAVLLTLAAMAPLALGAIAWTYIRARAIRAGRLADSPARPFAADAGSRTCRSRWGQDQPLACIRAPDFFSSC
jgi:hypothetical protein